MEIGLFFSPPIARNGPSKVAQNLLLGLKGLGIAVRHNALGQLNGALQRWAPFFDQLPAQTLIGPNINELPSRDPTPWQKHKQVVVASEWHARFMAQDPAAAQNSFQVWPVGIDTERFHDRARLPSSNECLVYFKQRAESELAALVSQLSRHGLTSRVLRYGNYDESELIDACNRCAFGVLLCSTETQGIAVMEMLSAGLPLLVLEIGLVDSLAEPCSTPYFDARCGVKVKQLDDHVLEDFRQRLSCFSPRRYIIAHHTLKQSALSYLHLLATAHGGTLEIH